MRGRGERKEREAGEGKRGRGERELTSKIFQMYMAWRVCYVDCIDSAVYKEERKKE